MPKLIHDWVSELPVMQQTVLVEAIRGPDTLAKYHPVKFLLRWYRRCILVSALDGEILDNPYDTRGGSFTGPSVTAIKGGYYSNLYRQGVLTEVSITWEGALDSLMDDVLRSVDEIPHHAWLHIIHGMEILGYKYPDAHIREWWHRTYKRAVTDMHMIMETEQMLNERLGDNKDGWLKHADQATTA